MMPHDTSPTPDAAPEHPGAPDQGAVPGASTARPADRMRRRVITGTLWSMLGIAALGLTRLIYNALIGRTGEPARLAEVNAQVSLAFFATFLTASATAMGASKFVAFTLARDGAASAAAVRRKLARWTVVGSIAVLLALVAGGRVILPGASWSDLIWVGALIAAYGAYTFTKAVLYAYDRAGRYAALEVTSDAAALCLTVIAVWWFPNALLAPLVVGYTGFAIAAYLSTPRSPTRQPPPDFGRELGGFVAYTAIGIAASQGLFQVAMVVARNLTDGDQAGAYAAAMSLVTPAFFLPRALALAFFPAAASAVGAGNRDLLARHTQATTRMLALIALPCFALAAMLGGPVLAIVFGADYAAGGPTFAVLVAAVFWYVVAVPSVNALSSLELTLARVPPLASVGGVVLGSGVWAGIALFTESPSAVGVAAGYLAAMTTQAGVPLVLATRHLGLSWGRLPLRFAVSVPAAAGLATAAILLGYGWASLACAATNLALFAVVHRRDLGTLAGGLGTLRADVRPNME